MKKCMKKFLVVLALSLFLAGVGSGIPIQNVTDFTAVEAASAIRISKSKATLIKGKTLQLSVIGTTEKIKWRSSDKTIATVNSSGKVTAVAKGTATITAKVGGIKYTCKVTVETPKLSKKSLVLNRKATYQLKVKGTTQKVKWYTSDKNVATVTSSGKITAVAKGTVTITAKVGGNKYKCKVTVENPKINKTTLKIREKETYRLKVSGTTQTVTWSSSDKTIAKVGSKGKVTAIKPGTVTITAKVNGKTLKCKVTVEKVQAAEPVFAVGMPDYTENSTYCTAMAITNRGSLPVTVYAAYAQLIDDTNESYDRDLVLVDYDQAYYNDRLVPINSVCIMPGKTEYLIFVTDISTRYNPKSALFYLFEYDGEEYYGISSSFYGSYYDVW